MRASGGSTPSASEHGRTRATRARGGSVTSASPRSRNNPGERIEQAPATAPRSRFAPGLRRRKTVRAGAKDQKNNSTSSSTSPITPRSSRWDVGDAESGRGRAGRGRRDAGRRQPQRRCCGRGRDRRDDRPGPVSAITSGVQFGGVSDESPPRTRSWGQTTQTARKRSGASSASEGPHHHAVDADRLAPEPPRSTATRRWPGSGAPGSAPRAVSRGTSTGRTSGWKRSRNPAAPVPGGGVRTRPKSTARACRNVRRGTGGVKRRIIVRSPAPSATHAPLAPTRPGSAIRRRPGSSSACRRRASGCRPLPRPAGS